MRGDGDGWVRCGRGHRHWGRYGAAGLLVRAPAGGGAPAVLLQLRAAWSHHGDTWGVPGGARDSDESVQAAALREVAEETTLDPGKVTLHGTYVDDHGGWSYTTVLGGVPSMLEVRPTSSETLALRWVDVAAVAELDLHPGLAEVWPELRRLAAGSAEQRSAERAGQGEESGSW